MDAADVLYGVSMGKGGVTKVVSRRFEQEQARARGGGRGGLSLSLSRADGVGGADPERRPGLASPERPGQTSGRAEQAGRFARLRERLAKSRQALRAELSASLFDRSTPRPGSGSRRR